MLVDVRVQEVVDGKMIMGKICSSKESKAGDST